MGARPAGLAHRVLGDGPHLPRQRIRHPRRRAGSDLPAPRERGRAIARRRRRVRPLLDALALGDHGRREDVQVAGQHPVGAGDHRAHPADRAAVLPDQRALPVVDRVLPGGAGRRGQGLRTDRVVPAPGRRSGGRRRGADRRRAGRVPAGDGRRPRGAAGAGRRARRGCGPGTPRWPPATTTRPPRSPASVRAMVAVLGLDPWAAPWADRRRRPAADRGDRAR